jgi:NAD(P)-dependent dehydrogenase (short-subunit alcohol dehydrogenase family)
MGDTTTPTLNPPLSQSNLSVSGRYFLITGGTQGLGLAVARLLKENGASGLILVSRSPEKGVAAVEELQDDNCQVSFVKADLGNAEEASDVFPRAEELIGDDHFISGVVNAAAVTSRGNLFTTTAETFDTQMAVNVRAPFLITQGAARHMTKHKCRGSIVNICSVAAHGGAPFVMAYSAAKAALVALTKNNAAELSPKGIRVNAINMGWCLTDNEDELQTCQTGDADWIQRADQGVPLGRILRPTDVAATVAFLLSDASAMMTASTIDLHPEFPHGMLSLLEEDVR